MALNTEERQQVSFIIGKEVEHTVCYGMKTLFVVGTPTVERIEEVLNDPYTRFAEDPITHVYFGTSQSFQPATSEDWQTWDQLISYFLKQNFMVTLDFDVAYAQEIHEQSWCEQENFVPMISVKLPYIRLYNYNTTIKLDDNTWGATNPGVWTHHLQSLMTRDAYTPWAQYTKDEAVE